jgi:hypothetical protein
MKVLFLLYVYAVISNMHLNMKEQCWDCPARMIKLGLVQEWLGRYVMNGTAQCSGPLREAYPLLTTEEQSNDQQPAEQPKRHCGVGLIIVYEQGYTDPSIIDVVDKR